MYSDVIKIESKTTGYVTMLKTENDSDYYLILGYKSKINLTLTLMSWCFQDVQKKGEKHCELSRQISNLIILHRAYFKKVKENQT